MDKKDREYFENIATLIKNDVEYMEYIKAEIVKLASKGAASHVRQYQDAYPEIMWFVYSFYPNWKPTTKKNPSPTISGHLKAFGIDRETGKPRGVETWGPPYIAWLYWKDDKAKKSHHAKLEKLYKEKAPAFSKFEPENLFETKEDVEKYEKSRIKTPPPIPPTPTSTPVPSTNSQQPILEIPEAGKNETHRFTSRALEVIGRDKEEEILKKFANESPGFSWMQIAGDGGQGKSRLALQLADTLKESWNIGFIPTRELRDFQDKWRDWVPDRPTLIIVDYIIADMKYLEHLLPYLSSHRKKFDLACYQKQKINVCQPVRTINLK